MKEATYKEMKSLNPYFNGIYFLIMIAQPHILAKECRLNPYFNGIYFLIPHEKYRVGHILLVLILILMEYTF